MLENLKGYHIYLASNSPRRKELLQRLGLSFQVRSLAGIDETYPEGLDYEEVAHYVARKKADAYRSLMQPNDLVITADTIVALDSRIFGKPHSLDHAKDMLRELSGRTHKVSTGVCVLTNGIERSLVATTDVTFANLSDDEICSYFDQYIPLDKAGSYGVQDWIGLIAVERIEGSYFNVMGLPVQRLYNLLKNIPPIDGTDEHI